MNTLRGVPYSEGLTVAQLYTGFPGVDGLSNQFAVTMRQSFQFDSADNGVMNMLGAPPVWNITAPGLLGYLGVWSGYLGDPDARFLFPALLLPSRQVADGDVFDLATVQLRMLGLVAV
jgi:hypothetical protein